MSPKWESGQLKKVVVVGHDVKQDVQHLHSLDFDVHEMENLLEIVDNQKLHQHRSKFYNGQSLCTVLAGLKIPYRFLHNAGNDAVYTLQSLLRLAVLKRHESLVRAWEKQESYVSTVTVPCTAPTDSVPDPGLRGGELSLTQKPDGALAARILMVVILLSNISVQRRNVSSTDPGSRPFR